MVPGEFRKPHFCQVRTSSLTSSKICGQPAHTFRPWFDYLPDSHAIWSCEKHTYRVRPTYGHVPILFMSALEGYPGKYLLTFYEGNTVVADLKDIQFPNLPSKRFGHLLKGM